MNLEAKIMDALKEAMKSKNQLAMLALRDIKSAILLFKTDGSNKELNEEEEIKILQRLVKKRKDSFDIFTAQNRTDLAEKEAGEIAIIEQFLPKQMSKEEIEPIIKEIIQTVGATSAKEMGKVMGTASKQLAGKADNKLISEIVKSLLPA